MITLESISALQKQFLVEVRIKLESGQYQVSCYDSDGGKVAVGKSKDLEEAFVDHLLT
jgi:hypothetical protein